MLSLIDTFLNKITMYRLVLQYLIVLLVIAGVFGSFGALPYQPANLAFSTLLILAVCSITNVVFARIFHAETNVESAHITALILALIITPVAPTDYAGIGFLVFASSWAMASKYIFAIGRKHLFNPAAFGVALGALMLGQAATWWAAGNLPLLPFIVIGGLLIVRKIRRFDVVASFGVIAILTIALTTQSASALASVIQIVLHSSLIFLAFIMLTEPLTMPPSRMLRVCYGAIVGLLFAPNVHLGSLYFTPELALLVGNVFVYIVSPKGRFMLSLVGKKEIADNTYEFIFTPDRPFGFRPGQYLEWTLGHRAADTRGNRRFFTIASSPKEEVLRLGVKFYEPASSFKRALGAMQKQDVLSVSHLAGDFVLPKNARKKLVFIAGGIGITPFRSMVQYLIDTQDPRSITLLYSNKTVSEIAYAEVFEAARQAIGMKTVYVLTNEPAPIRGASQGPIDASLITREIPDYAERIFYISGPHSMVEAFKKTLHRMGISRWNIKADYFPGFA